MMDSSTKWINSEDSFLQYFSSKEKFSWGERYYWAEGENWGKFNFVRVSDSKLPSFLSSTALSENIQWFKEKGKQLNLKVNFEFDHSNVSGCELDGTPIVYMVTDSSDLMGVVSSDVRLLRCSSKKEIERWWLVNSDGRNREDALKSPLFEPISSSAEKNTKYFILRYQDEDAACLATTNYNDGINIWGGATRKKFQKRGFIKDLMSLSLQEFAGDIYSQTNLDSIMHHYMTSLPSTKVLYIEKKLVFKQ